MANAKTEFIAHTNGLPKVKCAIIRDFDSDFKSAKGVTIILPVGYSDGDFESFLDNLDFEYDDGYGGQNLYGNIWYNGGTWSERGEYDGAEWWDYKATPKVPKDCK